MSFKITKQIITINNIIFLVNTVFNDDHVLHYHKNGAFIYGY